MRIAYLDCFSGISGDMFLGAAVDAGVSLEKLQQVCSGLGLNTQLTAERAKRGGLSATKVDVLIGGHPDQPVDLQHSHAEAQHSDQRPHVSPKSKGGTRGTHSHEHAHHGEHAHDHPHEHAHAHGTHTHSHEASHGHHVHRGLNEIRQIIARAPISTWAQAFALKAFELLAAAEGKIHGCDPESIHFHEVGSEDAIVDILCAAVAVEAIAAERWYCSALNVGSGTVQCAHGVMPVPAPATAELLKDAPVYSGEIRKELLTPTGAAILRALDVRFEPLPRMMLNATGYGAGARDFPGSANVVRLIVGEAITHASQTPHVSAATEEARNLHPSKPNTGLLGTPIVGHLAGEDNADTVVVLEANLDDMNPQLFSYVQQKLLDAGALDAFGVPVQMKKGRPGLIFTVLASPSQAELMARILLNETTTLGVRLRQEQRRILDRKHVTVESCWGPIRIKIGSMNGEVANFAPEFEDCRRIAEANGVPLKNVLQEAVRLYLDSARPANC